VRTIFEVILVGVILWFVFDKLSPGSSVSISGSGLMFNEAPGSVGSGYLSELPPGAPANNRGAAPAAGKAKASGGCGCGGIG